MSDDRPEWFAPRRFGFGVGWPVAWQGWVLTGILFALFGLAWWLFGNNDARALAIILPALIAFVVIAALTTRGGLGWHWGDDR